MQTLITFKGWPKQNPCCEPVWPLTPRPLHRSSRGINWSRLPSQQFEDQTMQSGHERRWKLDLLRDRYSSGASLLGRSTRHSDCMSNPTPHSTNFPPHHTPHLSPHEACVRLVSRSGSPGSDAGQTIRSSLASVGSGRAAHTGRSS